MMNENADKTQTLKQSGHQTVGGFTRNLQQKKKRVWDQLVITELKEQLIEFWTINIDFSR